MTRQIWPLEILIMICYHILMYVISQMTKFQSKKQAFLKKINISAWPDSGMDERIFLVGDACIYYNRFPAVRQKLGYFIDVAEKAKEDIRYYLYCRSTLDFLCGYIPLEYF